jgi:hypothetical protein
MTPIDDIKNLPLGALTAAQAPCVAHITPKFLSNHKTEHTIEFSMKNTFRKGTQ